MLDTTTAEALIRSFTLGSARQKVPVERAFAGVLDPTDPKAELQALALVGQRQRFLRRHQGVVVAQARAASADPRRIVPEAMRQPLVRLFSGRDGSHDDVLAAAVAAHLDKSALRLHPFDLPRLDAFVKAHREQLGTEAIAWAERNAAAEDKGEADDYFAIEKIDADNWQKARPAQMAAFIRGRRRDDPDAARDLVASVFAAQPAAARVQLLKALIVRLGPADGPFLASLAKDRAPTVREAAERLLAHLPGTPEALKRVGEAVSRLKTGKAGLLKRRLVIKLETPANVQKWQAEQWAVDALGGIPLAMLADALGVDVESLCAAAAEDNLLATVLAAQALAEGRLDLLSHFGNGSANLWVILDRTEDLDLSDAATADRLTATLIGPNGWRQIPPAHRIAQLYLATRRPMDEASFDRLTASGGWRGLMQRASGQPGEAVAAYLGGVAALTPRSRRKVLRAATKDLEPVVTGRAHACLDLLDEIDALSGDVK